MGEFVRNGDDWIWVNQATLKELVEAVYGIIESSKNGEVITEDDRANCYGIIKKMGAEKLGLK